MLCHLRLFLSILTLALTVISATAQTPPDPFPFAEPIQPNIHLRWDPEARMAKVAFSGGCMSSSIGLLGNTLTAIHVPDTSEIVMEGVFWIDNRAVLRATDFGNCPQQQITLPDLPYGTYTVRYAQGERQEVQLAEDRIDLTVRIDPKLTPRHIKHYHRFGVAPFITPPRTNMPSKALELLGPAVILPQPDSLLTHVAPDPTIWWFSEVNTLSIGVGLRCLPADHLYMGNTTWAELNRSTRTLTLHGDLRFLPWPVRGPKPDETSDCLNLNPGGFEFEDVDPGTYRVMQEEQALFEVTLGDEDISAHRIGVFPMR